MPTSFFAVLCFLVVGSTAVGFGALREPKIGGGLRELVGDLQPDSEARDGKLAMDVGGTTVHLSLERAALAGTCAARSEGKTKLRAYGDVDPEQRMLLLELDIDCGGGWFRFEKFRREEAL